MSKMAIPTGFLNQPGIDIQQLISESANFQTWVGAGDAATALLKVFLYETDPDFDDNRYAIVSNLAEFSGTKDVANVGVAAYRFNSGVMFGFIEAIEYSQDNAIDFLNNAGAIIKDLFDFQTIINGHQIDNFEMSLGEDAAFRWEHGERRGYQIYIKEGQVI